MDVASALRLNDQGHGHSQPEEVERSDGHVRQAVETVNTSVLLSSNRSTLGMYVLGPVAQAQQTRRQWSCPTPSSRAYTLCRLQLSLEHMRAHSEPLYQTNSNLDVISKARIKRWFWKRGQSVRSEAAALP